MNNTAYIYIRSEPGLWTVGFYDYNGKWQPESDHGSLDDACKRVAYLNGSETPAKNAALAARLAEAERVIERAGGCLAMSNNGAREALVILRGYKERNADSAPATTRCGCPYCCGHPAAAHRFDKHGTHCPTDMVSNTDRETAKP